MTRMRAPERRRQLLEVAARLFASRGYRGTTTAELAAEAGVTEPILYRHFPSKHDLFVTLVEEVSSEVVDAWRERLAGLDDPRERLEALLGGNPATDPRGAGVYRVIFQAMTEVDEEDEIAGAIRDHIETLHGFLKREVAAGQKAGVVRDDETAADLAWTLVYVAIGYGMVAGLGKAMSRAGMQRLVGDLFHG